MLDPGVGPTQAWLSVGQFHIAGMHLITLRVAAPPAVVVRLTQSLAALDHAHCGPPICLQGARPLGRCLTHRHRAAFLLPLGGPWGPRPRGHNQRSSQGRPPLQVRLVQGLFHGHRTWHASVDVGRQLAPRQHVVSLQPQHGSTCEFDTITQGDIHIAQHGRKVHHPVAPPS